MMAAALQHRSQHDQERRRNEPTHTTTPEKAAHISAQIAEYEAISERLRSETEGMSQQNPHQWVGMNSDQDLTIANTLPELLEN